MRMTVMYKDESPFPAGERSRTGCFLCDSYMRSTIVNTFKSQKQQTPQEIEAAKKAKEERKRLQEEKKK